MKLKALLNDRPAERKLEEASLGHLSPDVLTSRIRNLTRKIHRSRSVSEKLDLLASQNELVAALVTQDS